MYNYSELQWWYLFLFYCIVGWIIESTYVSIRTKKLTNRGFMRGPWLPIYGCGFVGWLLISGSFGKNPILIYVIGTISGSALELVTGEIMEAIFNVRYWDYSYRKYNFRGQICLPNSLYWGIFALLSTFFIQAPVEAFMLLIPIKLMRVLVGIGYVIMGADFALSMKAAIDMRDILTQLHKAKSEMKMIQKRLDVVIAVTSDGVKDEVDDLKVKYAVLKERVRALTQIRDINLRDMIKGNPGMVSRKFQDALDTVKSAVYRKNKVSEDDIDLFDNE